MKMSDISQGTFGIVSSYSNQRCGILTETHSTSFDKLREHLDGIPDEVVRFLVNNSRLASP
jgi:hypothetical protein